VSECLPGFISALTWTDRKFEMFFVHPPRSQEVNFDAPITLCVFFYAKSSTNQKKVPHAIPNRPEVIHTNVLIGSINRRDV
jgi:hypothetical protein